MLFKVDCEFRGKSIKTNEKGTYYYVSIETADDDGEALKFPSVDFSEFLKGINKGDRVTAFIDYSTKYNSLKLVNMVKSNGK